MNDFDVAVLHHLNQFARTSWLFDESVSQLGRSVFQGALFIAVLWWLWFRTGESQLDERETILSGLATTFAALMVARVLADLLPFRTRPVDLPILHVHVPYGIDPSALIHWSSFPSDHAVFYFALATCIFIVSVKIGAVAYIYTFFVICLPLIYSGQHFPTDVLVGAVLGIGIASLSLNVKLRRLIAKRPLRWLEKSPGTFYAVFFFVSYLFATQFDPVRDLVYSAWKGVHECIQALH
jgi:undecaprenyl-diphosphatase